MRSKYLYVHRFECCPRRGRRKITTTIHWDPLTLDFAIGHCQSRRAKRDSMWLTRMQFFFKLSRRLCITNPVTNYCRLYHACSCRNMQSSSVFEYCCMKISHIIRVHQGTSEIIHIHYSCYYYYIQIH